MFFIKQRIGKLVKELEALIYSDDKSLTNYKIAKSSKRFKSLEELNSLQWQDMPVQHFSANPREYYYFKVNIEIPSEYENKTVIYEVSTGKEGENEGPWDSLNPQLLVYVNGKLRQGFDANHRDIILAEKAVVGDLYEIVLSAYTGDTNFSMFLKSEIKVLNRQIEKYYYDIAVPYQVAELLDEESKEYFDIIECLNNSLNLLDLRRKHSKEFYQSLEKAQENITANFYDKKCEPADTEVICCVGHTHIDCAWLWTLTTTEDKAVRSFSTVLELMDQYPEYKFMSSQPQLYAYVKKNAPEVYGRIKEKVAKGQWETEGGMWLEADCNIASGESLVRQFIYGKRFFREEFNKDNEILWLPDVFGYSAALPQIMKKSGINYFMTTKISWSEFNKMPYDTFYWEGIDGTNVLTHFSPTADYNQGFVPGGPGTAHFTTYNSLLDPSQVKGNWKRYSQKELHTDSLMAFGFGDGGGGPTKRMLENCRRMEKGIPGCPTTRQSHALDFFKKLENDVQDNKYTPKWVGELYLEFHRGTYTSMGRNKRYNRKSELAYQNLELYSSLAKLLTGMPYPKQELREAWEVILRNQFHDILPGSSIKAVYDESKQEYDRILDAAEDLTNRALSDIVANIAGDKNDIVIFNPNSTGAASLVMIHEDDEGYDTFNNLLASIDNPSITDGSSIYPLQKIDGGYAAVVENISSKGYKTFKLIAYDNQIISSGETVPSNSKKELSKKELSKNEEYGSNAENKTANDIIVHNEDNNITEIETPYFSVELNSSGQFTRIYDKEAEREIIPIGKVANQIISYEDKPHNFDAWDINNYYTEKSWEVKETTSIELIENGPVLACIKIEHPYLESRIVQYIYFYKNLKLIDIRNEIDWEEQQILLRDYFPVDVHTSEATFEIQYGNVKRATHNNTSWDYAKFEVCAHKWLDVSEDGYGVSILNDCKYGCNVKDGTIGLSMLKSPIYPNPEADKEHHTFWYSIAPHSNDFKYGKTTEKAYAFNNPLTAYIKTNEGGKLERSLSLISVEEDNVIIEVVKQAEDSESIVVRLYECFNRRGNIHIHLGMPIEEAWETNLLEQPEANLKVCDNEIITTIMPYEIKTIILKTC